MADDVRLICWSTPERLGFGIQMRNLAGQLHSSSEEFVQIDTGYSEELLIPETLFERLRLEHWQFPGSVTAKGTTVTGQVIRFIEAPVDVIIPKTGQQHRVVVQTFPSNERFLIGRKFLRNFKMILDGPGSQTCMLSPLPSVE